MSEKERKAKTRLCVYCGNNQVPHFFNWYFESLNLFLTPLRSWLIANSFSSLFRRLFVKANFGLLMVQLFKTVRIISFQTDVAKCKVRRAQVLWEEAEARGLRMVELLLFGKAFDVYMAWKDDGKFPISKSRMVFAGLPRPAGYDAAALDVLDDKLILKQNFIKRGLPVPAGGSAWNFRQALKIFRRVKKPVIVKPRAGSRGRHSTTFVRTEQDLKISFKVAKKLCFWVMVEEQLEGPVYRATVINFQLEGVLRGDPPLVVGDGVHSIGQLIAIKNSLAHPGVKDILIDDAMVRFIERSLRDSRANRHPDRPSAAEGVEGSLNSGDISNFLPEKLDYVPAEGESLILSEKIGVNYGGSSSEDFTICHPDNKELFVRAAKAVRDPLVGFDFIIPDISQSFKNQRSGFIEANSLPFINLHHDPLLGAPRNVAAKVWDMVGF